MPPLFSNVPALRLTLAYVLHDPASLLPHSQVPTLLQVAVPISSQLPTKPKVRALVLDKDNTLCPPRTSHFSSAYKAKLKEFQEAEEFAHNSSSILIVSNTAGSTSSPEHEAEAVLLEKETGLPVLRQQPGRKKPLCGPDILAFFKERGVTDNPREIVVLGDRLATDVLLARQMGSWSIWCKDGWKDSQDPERSYVGFFGRLEQRLERLLRERFNKSAPLPETSCAHDSNS